jgi:uroporphyrinogen decarboxylase
MISARCTYDGGHFSDRYSSGGQFLEQLAASGADVISIDHTISVAEAKARLAAAGYPTIGIQGNLDSKILCDGTHDEIRAATAEILAQAGNTGHVMNLGHGIEAATPEPNAAMFVDYVQAFKH